MVLIIEYSLIRNKDLISLMFHLKYYYDVLGVPNTAPVHEIEDAYQKLTT